jgi:hypothetical protein
MSAFGTGQKRQVRLTEDQQSVDNTARGDGNAEGRQRQWKRSAEHTA